MSTRPNSLGSNSLASSLGALFGHLDDDMLVACAQSTEPQEALGRMSLATLESIVRELRRDGSQYLAESAAIDDAVSRVSDAVDEFFRMLDPNFGPAESSVDRAHEEVQRANDDLLKQLCVATVMDTDWWREVAR